MVHGITPWDKGHEAPARALGTVVRKATRTVQVLLLPQWRWASLLTGLTLGGQGVITQVVQASCIFQGFFPPCVRDPLILPPLPPQLPLGNAGSPCAECRAQQQQQGG